MIIDVLKAAVKAIEQGETFAMASVIESDGSSPGKPGHKMLIFSDGRLEGTVGGGQLEHRVIKEAREMIARGAGGMLDYSFDPDSTDSIGMMCGGRATVAVEVVIAPARVLLCGGGHVARALGRQLSELGLVHAVADDRPEVATPEAFPHAAEIIHTSPARYVAEVGLERFTHVIVMTHTHALDSKTVHAVAQTGFQRYVGLIGSRRKWEKIRGQLAEAGVPEAWISRVHCPIGLEIGAHTPAEIALSIAAELVKEAHQGD